MSEKAVQQLKDVSDEGEWHEFLERWLKAAGWHVRHEVTCNEDASRVDFILHHSELNESYDQRELVGLEAKYTDNIQSGVAARTGAQQIQEKYQDKTWLNKGEEVRLWAVAPYCEKSHTGTKSQAAASRGGELGAATILQKAGIGYLVSWIMAPAILFDGVYVDIFPDEERAHCPGIPAFVSHTHPMASCHLRDDELSMLAEVAESRAQKSGLLQDRDEERRIRERYYKNSGFDDGQTEGEWV